MIARVASRRPDGHRVPAARSSLDALQSRQEGRNPPSAGRQASLVAAAALRASARPSIPWSPLQSSHRTLPACRLKAECPNGGHRCVEASCCRGQRQRARGSARVVGGGIGGIALEQHFTVGAMTSLFGRQSPANQHASAVFADDQGRHWIRPALIQTGASDIASEPASGQSL